MQKLLFLAPLLLVGVGCTDNDADRRERSVDFTQPDARDRIVVDTERQAEVVSNDLGARIDRAEANLRRAEAEMIEAADQRYEARVDAARRDLRDAKAERARFLNSTEATYETHRRNAEAAADRLDASMNNLESTMRELGHDFREGVRDLKQDAADLKNSAASDRDGIPLNDR